MTKEYTWADIDHFQLTGEAMIEIANRSLPRTPPNVRPLASPTASKSPQSLSQQTKAECLAEIAELTEMQREAYEASMSLPPGPECESAGEAMVFYRDRRIRLGCAIRDGEVE